ncbi:MAG: hypothetical protein L3K08_00960, partial [Thermoplasmata archaeon]|nr:hypothetical protein [Thermoplasmata archaeon]
MARPIAVALAVVIALSALMVAPHLGDARGASIHASPHPAFLSILAVNGNGATSPFHSGLGSGTIYFIAGGGVLNATGNVTITDQNASRDGVPTPAKVFEIVFRGGTTNDSRGTANYYQIPLNLNYTGEWNITLNTSGTSVTSTFLVEAFAVYFTTDRSGYLPGHSGTIYWLVERDANGAPFTDYTSLQIAGSYRNNTSVVSALSFPSHTLTVAANGTIPFTVPADAQTGYSVNIVMWANQTKVGTKTNWSSSHTYDPQVDAINNLNLAFINCGVCGTFRTGTPVEVSIDVQLTGSGIADGLLATVTFYSGTQAVTAPSGTPTSLTTNGSGRAALVFVPMQPAFSTTHNNSVSVTLTDPKDPGVKVTNFIDFDLTNVSASARVQVTLNQATYYSGDTVTATWVVGGINATAPVGWKISEVYAEGYSNGRYSLFEYGTVNTTATTGTFTFQVPADFQGELYVYAVIANATQETENGVAAVILPPTIFVNPSEAIYQAGDSISVSVTTEGQAFSTATLSESPSVVLTVTTPEEAALALRA